MIHTGWQTGAGDLHKTLTILCAILTGVTVLNRSACAALVSPVSGPDYLSLLEATRRPGSQSFEVRGILSGTIGTTSTMKAIIVDSGRVSEVGFSGIKMPPMGSDIRVIVHCPSSPDPSGASLVADAWAYSGDVARSGSYRKAVGLSSRGGYAVRTDHTSYFNLYAQAIARLNPSLSSNEVDEITGTLLRTSRDCDVDPRLVMAVVLAESGFNPKATSPKGAMGLGQLMPSTAYNMGIDNPYDAKKNLDASIRILRSGLKKYSGGKSWKELNWNHLHLALAAYNAGSGAVRKYGGVPPYRETRKYIEKVTSYYKQLCGVK